MKNNLSPGEFVIGLDFSQNFTFQVQNAIQAQHWNNAQVTLHPYVAYYRQNNKLKHDSFVIISENTDHDCTAVHLFNEKMIAFLKNRHGSENVKKLHYFSDGAGSQYKNKYNFINLLYHEEDFGVQAVWHFFATAHGKGACDGIGGKVKREAFKASMQRVDRNPINTPRLFFEWAQSFFKKIKFDFCTLDEHLEQESLLQERYAVAKTIKNTRQFHFYSPINETTIMCKVFSDDTTNVQNGVVKKPRQESEFSLSTQNEHPPRRSLRVVHRALRQS